MQNESIFNKETWAVEVMTSATTQSNLKDKIQLSEVRCMKCNRLLGKLKGKVEIKCPKCKVYNSFNE